jgi:DNA-binding NtrC family response regulator
MGLVPPARDSRAEVVLLVENDPSACDLYRTALGACGFAVISARHDVDAIRRLAAAKPDAVVVNLAATRDNGRCLLAAIGSHAAVIAITDDHDLAADGELGFACVFPTPVDLDLLIDAITRCLANWHSQKATR